MKKQILALTIALTLATGLLAGCAATANSGSAAVSSVPAAQSSSAASSETAPTEPLFPVAGTALLDGTYPIEVESSSSMFRVVKAELTAKNGTLSAVLTLSGTGYGYLYMGTGAQAQAAPESEYIPYVVDAEGQYTYAVPVAALNLPTDCAAWSIKKETWYDRVLVFKADTLPAAAFAEQPVAAAVQDGNYQVNVTLGGGSGRVSLVSPALLSVENGKMTATLEWSSPYYDYMLVEGNKYTPVNAEGNSVFCIPVAALDCELAVTADTTAMSKAHEIDYTLHFDSTSLKQEP